MMSCAASREGGVVVAARWWNGFFYRCSPRRPVWRLGHRNFRIRRCNNEMPGQDQIRKLPVAGTLLRSSVDVIGLAEWDLACLLMVQAMQWLRPLNCPNLSIPIVRSGTFGGRADE
jgi:hypothetical protein